MSGLIEAEGSKVRARQELESAAVEWGEFVEHARRIGAKGPLGSAGLAIRGRLLEAACAHHRACEAVEKAHERERRNASFAEVD